MIEPTAVPRYDLTEGRLLYLVVAQWLAWSVSETSPGDPERTLGTARLHRKGCASNASSDIYS